MWNTEVAKSGGGGGEGEKNVNEVIIFGFFDVSWATSGTQGFG